jgi:hypothetical protein
MPFASRTPSYSRIKSSNNKINDYYKSTPSEKVKKLTNLQRMHASSKNGIFFRKILEP